MTYFKYTLKQRKVAIMIFINAVVLFLMYMAAHRYLPQMDQPEATEELLYWLDIVIWPIEAILLFTSVYFWIENKAVDLWVTPTELHYFDPTFGDYGWTVPVKEIVAIEQFTNVQRTGTTNHVVLKSGDYKQIMYGNYSIDRKALFDALQKANPAIILPENPYHYKVSRPSWARRWLNKSK